MAEINIFAPDELFTSLEKMSRLGEVAPRMLKAGIQPVKKAVQKNAKRHVQTGQMADSISTTRPKKDKNGDYGVYVTFKGKDKETGVANAQKAFVTEYGKSTQDASPFVRPAVVESEKQAIAAMQEVFEFETQLDKIKV